MSATCSSCGSRIRWIRTSKGKRMPLDEMPVANGNVWLFRHQIYGMVAIVGKRGEAPADPLAARYQSHFTSCAQAKQHRRRG